MRDGGTALAERPRSRAGHGRSPVQLSRLAPSRLGAAIAGTQLCNLICHVNASVYGHILGSRRRPAEHRMAGCSSACTSSSAAAPGSSAYTRAEAYPIGPDPSAETLVRPARCLEPPPPLTCLMPSPTASRLMRRARSPGEGPTSGARATRSSVLNSKARRCFNHRD